MKNRIFRFGAWAFILPLAVSCNLYKPFEGGGSVQDLLELAQSCLRDNDLACAAEKYNALPDGSLKDQKLCTLAISQAGFTLPTLIKVLSKGSKAALVSVANSLIPYTAEHETAVNDAVTKCTKFKGDADAGDAGKLFNAVSLVARCGTLIAKSDQFQGTNDDKAASCAPASLVANKATNGSVDSADIDSSAGASGVADAAHPGMCAADVKQCGLDILAADTALKSTSTLKSIGDTLDALNAAGLASESVDSAPAIQQYRKSLASSVTGK